MLARIHTPISAIVAWPPLPRGSHKQLRRTAQHTPVLLLTGPPLQGGVIQQIWAKDDQTLQVLVEYFLGPEPPPLQLDVTTNATKDTV